jgi:uncharacterized membrane protein
MISDLPKNTKYTIVAVITVIFVSSLVFAYVMINSDYAADESAAFTYAAVFATVFICLNVLLLVIAIRTSRKMKRESLTKKCESCSSTMDRDETKCPQCNAIQVTDDTYLDPKTPNNEVVPKKQGRK